MNLDYSRELASVTQMLEDEAAYLAKYEAGLANPETPSETKASLARRIEVSRSDIAHYRERLAQLQANPPAPEPRRRYLADWQIEQDNMTAQAIRQGFVKAEDAKTWEGGNA